MINLILYSIFNEINKNLPIELCNTISSYLEMQLYFMPKEIQNLIIEFIPYKYKILFNKSYYIQYHKFALFSPFDSYVRFVIRNNMYFVLDNLLSENVDQWKKTSKKLYKKYNCDAYIKLLNIWCITYKSNKCRELLISYIK